MLAAEIWHWWIGIVLAGGTVLAGVVLLAGYLATVTSKQHPRGKKAREADL